MPEEIGEGRQLADYDRDASVVDLVKGVAEGLDAVREDGEECPGEPRRDRVVREMAEEDEPVPHGRWYEGAQVIAVAGAERRLRRVDADQVNGAVDIRPAPEQGYGRVHELIDSLEVREASDEDDRGAPSFRRLDPHPRQRHLGRLGHHHPLRLESVEAAVVPLVVRLGRHQDRVGERDGLVLQRVEDEPVPLEEAAVTKAVEYLHGAVNADAEHGRTTAALSRSRLKQPPHEGVIARTAVFEELDEVDRLELLQPTEGVSEAQAVSLEDTGDISRLIRKVVAQGAHVVRTEPRGSSETKAVHFDELPELGIGYVEQQDDLVAPRQQHVCGMMDEDSAATGGRRVDLERHEADHGH